MANTPRHLTYIFNPVPNRVNLKILFYVLILQTLLINPISVLFKKKQDKTKDETIMQLQKNKSQWQLSVDLIHGYLKYLIFCDSVPVTHDHFQLNVV